MRLASVLHDGRGHGAVGEESAAAYLLPRGRSAGDLVRCGLDRAPETGDRPRAGR